MKRRTILCLLPALGLLLGASGWLWQWPLATGSEAPAYQLALTEPVYRHAHDPALRDVAVLDAEGRQVPAAVFASRDGERPRQFRALPWFALPMAAEAEAARLDIISQRDGEGRVLRVESRETAKPRMPSGYLLDASQLPQAPLALRLGLAEGVEVEAEVQVEGSDDLVHWQPLQAPTAIVQLAGAGRQLRQNRIPLPQAARYLRLRVGGKTALPLQSVEVELPAPRQETVRQWRQFQGRIGKEANSFEFQSDGRQPFDQASVILPGNAAVRVWLESREAADAPWQARTGPWVQYRLAQAQSSGSPSFAPVRHRYWRLRSEQPLPAVPVLELGWRSEQLIFIATGTPPYRLVAGSARQQRQQAPVDALLADLRRQQGKGWQPEPLELTAEGSQADAGALAAVRDYKRFALWGLLLAAVLLVAGFALSLLRNSPQKEGNGP